MTNRISETTKYRFTLLYGVNSWTTNVLQPSLRPVLYYKKRLTANFCWFFGNFRGGYPDLGVQACVRTLAPPNPVFFTANMREPGDIYQ